MKNNSPRESCFIFIPPLDIDEKKNYIYYETEIFETEIHILYSIQQRLEQGGLIKCIRSSKP